MKEQNARRIVRSAAELRVFVGQEIAVSHWKRIDQELVDRHAGVSGNDHWLHVDPVKARTSPFGGTIAHGFLTLALLDGGFTQASGIDIDLGTDQWLNYGINRLRFPSPVPVGRRIRQHTTLLEVNEIGDQCVEIITRELVEIEGLAKPALVADWIGRAYFSWPE